MNNLNERLKEVITLKTDSKDRFKRLEDLTGIPRTAWSNLLKGKQRATHEMIEMCCRLWKEWITYITTGEGQKPILDTNQNVYEVLNPTDSGIHLKRDANGRAITNVRHSLNVQTRLNAEHSETDLVEFEWGYIGKGSLELAGNILYMYTYRPDKDRIAWLADAFCKEVIATLPHKEAYLSPNRIKDWIDEQEKKEVTAKENFNWSELLKKNVNKVESVNNTEKYQSIKKLLKKEDVNKKT